MNWKKYIKPKDLKTQVVRCRRNVDFANDYSAIRLGLYGKIQPIYKGFGGEDIYE